MVELYYKTLPTKLHFNDWMIWSFLFFISKTRNLTIANIPFSVLFLCLSFAVLLLGLNFNSWLKIVDILSILKYSIFKNVEIFNIYISQIKNLACHSQRSFFPEIWAFFIELTFLIKTRGYGFYFINNNSKSTNSKQPLQVD